MPVKTNVALRALIKHHVLQGKSITESAFLAGVSYYSAVHHTRMLLLAGEIPSASVRKTPADRSGDREYNRIRMQYRKRFGRMSDLVAGLQGEHLVWLLDQIPEGGTFSDVLRSIIVDAYDDDTG
jgi:hypothetical protein